MSALRLTKPQKTLTAIIESEGAEVTGFRKGANHLKVDFTFDGVHMHTQHLPYGETTSTRWEKNFRAAIRRTKNQED